MKAEDGVELRADQTRTSGDAPPGTASRGAMDVQWVPVGRLRLDPHSPRIHNDAPIHVAASIRRFGWQQPIVARRNGDVISGNARLKAALDLGMESVPVAWFDGPASEATAYGISDNRTNEFSEWDDRVLVELIRELQTEDALGDVGFSEADLDELISRVDAELASTHTDDQGPEAPPKEVVSRTGDLWKLGQHRLLCGDSTRSEDIGRLMEGKRAVLLATDPYYCTGYSGQRPQGAGKDWSANFHDPDSKDLASVLRSALSALLPHLSSNAGIYIWHAHMQSPTVFATLREMDILAHQAIVWVKPTATFGHSVYRWAHEVCVFGWKQGHKPRRELKESLTTVWEVDHDEYARVVGNEHPTQKPVRLFEIPMEMHTRPGELVLEPFCGSGTQIMAAERLQRRCYALEIEPIYVDVAVRRWERATGKEAVLDGSGETYAVVAAQRREQ